MGLIPDFEILLNGKPIEPFLKQRIKSIRVEDHQAEKSDGATIIIDDRDEDIEEIAKGTTLEVRLGYAKDLQMVGRFKVSTSYSSGPPGAVFIKATGFDASSAIKEKKSRKFDEKTADEILRKIAAEHGLEPKISSEFKSAWVPEGMAQCKESDLHYGSRLAEHFGGVFKINDGKLIASKRVTGRTASGKSLAAVEITRDQVTRYTTKEDELSGYKSAKCFFRDLQTGKVEEIFVGLGGPVLTISETFSSKELALQTARSKLGKAESKSRGIELELPGDARLTVERPVNLSGFKKGIFNGRWIVAETNHEWTPDRGYQTTVTLQKTLSKGARGEEENQSENAER